jgi:hypothetical protein
MWWCDRWRRRKPDGGAARMGKRTMVFNNWRRFAEVHGIEDPRKARAAYRASQAAYERGIRAEHRRNGVCTECGGPRDIEGRLRCRACTERLDQGRSGEVPAVRPLRKPDPPRRAQVFASVQAPVRGSVARSMFGAVWGKLR